MDILFEKQRQQLALTATDFVRSAMLDINWKARLIGIKGARGIGKTTLLLQYIKINLSQKLESTLYISLDNIWFSNNSLVSLVDKFVKHGGKHLFLDEVHKYPNWSQEVKNIYDDYPLLKIVFTGSSLLEILNARADLSRRAILYQMQGLSFREYLDLEKGIKFEPLALADIIQNHTSHATNINKKIKPLKYFNTYLKQGYYPFYKEQPDLYASRIENIINMMLEIELPLLRKVDLSFVHKIKQLLLIISEAVPFIPNVSKLSQKIGINRNTLLLYLHYIEEIGLTYNMYKKATGISKLQKPNKIYLENTNLMQVLSPSKVNKGNLRETFFANQVAYKHKLLYTTKGDFSIDEKYVVEVGDQDKKYNQIKDMEHAFIASDNIEYGYSNRIPLWLFGFLY